MRPDEKIDLAFQRFLKKKLGLCYNCKHAIFLGDGWGVWCRAKKRMYYTKIKKCQYYEKDEMIVNQYYWIRRREYDC
ncbi:MAG TPA: hypothetical protein ENF41_03950 [Candidatus Bathyarchaeota archaeon]|nr:hypothetical protein [Candidatus Bathyarchaeota archaeon]